MTGPARADSKCADVTPLEREQPLHQVRDDVAGHVEHHAAVRTGRRAGDLERGHQDSTHEENRS